MSESNKVLQVPETRFVGPVEMAYLLLEWPLDCCAHDCASCRKQIEEVRALLRQVVIRGSNFAEWWDKVGILEMPKHDQPPEHATIAEKAWNAALCAATHTKGRRVRRWTVDRLPRF